MNDSARSELIETSVQIDGNRLSFETGRIARQTDGSVIARWGDTVVLATVVSSRNRREEADFFPLTVDYREKYAGAGRIPGGYFRREGKPSEHEILTSRIIDRSIRPLFPRDYRSETQVTCTLLGFDPKSDVQIATVNAATLALYISDIPWNGPVASIRVIRVSGDFHCVPVHTDTALSSLDLVVTCSKSGLVMVEGEASEESESVVLDALEYARSEAAKVIEAMEDLMRASGSVKRSYAGSDGENIPQDKDILSYLEPRITRIYDTKPEKRSRMISLNALKEESEIEFKGNEVGVHIEACFEDILKKVVRERIRGGTRIDGRDMASIRPVSGCAGFLKTAHGSGVFTRGETQAIVTCTLGTTRDELEVDAVSFADRKRFYLHYNFPPYAVGEARPSRGPGRREIGHGNLAARALTAVLPDHDDFPYTIRIDSEITESNGSSSMATVCGATLALMDAGVPISSPVAGVAMGLVSTDNGFIVLTDITGEEDHCGDMDFKVAGTKRGITAIQLDNKLGSIPFDVLSRAFHQARDGRIEILRILAGILEAPRPELGNNAPRIATLRIRKNRVRELIGPGGRTIQDIQARSGARIEVAENGSVKVYTSKSDELDHALRLINEVTGHARIGELYEGTVMKVTDYGSYIRLLGSIDGFLPSGSSGGISPILGDKIPVIASGVDDRGRILLESAVDTSQGDTSRTESNE